MTESAEKGAQLKVSVRDLVAFSQRGGDLHNHQFGSITALEGLRGHQRLQEARGPSYTPEVSVGTTYAASGFSLLISGRMDGLFQERNPPVVEEIKTTRRPFDEIAPEASKLHLAQGKMYAVLYAREADLAAVVVQLTYFNIDSGQTHSLRETCSREELDAFFEDVVGQYLNWAKRLHDYRQARDRALAGFAFPFAQYRSGQRNFSIAAYRAIRDRARLFAQAPTGIGKTMGALFPALKALGEGHTQRIFFLTAKTSGAQLAVNALTQMRAGGLPLKSVAVTAKDKLCFDAPCNPERCPYALGYYDRLRGALDATFEVAHVDRHNILELAQTHTLCPFELSLDLALNADVLICDYNYAFDPGSYLRRFFGGDGSGNALLIDEAHNLVDRSRAMYSAELSKRMFLEVARLIKTDFPTMEKAVKAANRAFGKVAKALPETEEHVGSETPEDLLPALLRFCRRFETWLGEEEPEEVPAPLRELYFEVRRFLRCAEFFDDRFATLYRGNGRQLAVKIQCLDASDLLAKMLDGCGSAAFFSATLSPFPYYTSLLGGSGESPRVNLPSPFPPEHLCLLVAGHISTLYRDRTRSLDALARTIGQVVAAREGNYLVYFPSYKYLILAVEAFAELGLSAEILIQESGMSDQERQQFLDQFTPDRQGTLVGFAVMGGSFGEGIDLVGEALIGVVVVGVGLPMICTERNLMKQYFAARGAPGFAYAYQYPGMNRVLQTAGRVIRDSSDRGVVCLIDSRFNEHRYRELFPPHWQPHYTRDEGALAQHLQAFWSRVEPP